MTEREKVWAERARKLGATKIEEGCNWTWARGFPTKEAAEEFDKTPGMETRGVYPMPSSGTFDVLFRQP